MAQTVFDMKATDLITEHDQKELDEFFQTLRSPDWVVSSSSKDGLIISWMKNDKSDVLLVKGEMPINVPVKKAFGFISDDNRFEEFMKTVDGMCKSAKLVETLDAKHSVKYASYSLPPPLWPRDFVWEELNTTVPSGGALSIGKSVEHKACPPSTSSFFGSVRGEIAGSGYYIEPCDGADGKCIGHYLVQVDPKGMLPTAAVNLMATDQGKNLRRLKEYLEKEEAVGR
jgi:hypothetical protein|uniref:START domain-containing protein n=1 Tax=Eutreptiella gymnastica TaxID=73025 RepID=A0A7S4C841_9EUGL